MKNSYMLVIVLTMAISGVIKTSSHEAWYATSLADGKVLLAELSEKSFVQGVAGGVAVYVAISLCKKIYSVLPSVKRARKKREKEQYEELYNKAYNGLKASLRVENSEFVQKKDIASLQNILESAVKTLAMRCNQLETNLAEVNTNSIVAHNRLVESFDSWVDAVNYTKDVVQNLQVEFADLADGRFDVQNEIEDLKAVCESMNQYLMVNRALRQDIAMTDRIQKLEKVVQDLVEQLESASK